MYVCCASKLQNIISNALYVIQQIILNEFWLSDYVNDTTSMRNTYIASDSCLNIRRLSL